MKIFLGRNEQTLYDFPIIVITELYVPNNSLEDLLGCLNLYYTDELIDELFVNKKITYEYCKKLTYAKKKRKEQIQLKYVNSCGFSLVWFDDYEGKWKLKKQF